MNATISRALAVERQRDLIAEAERARAAGPRSTRRASQILRELMFAARREPAPAQAIAFTANAVERAELERRLGALR